jgi:hypothetical protein
VCVCICEQSVAKVTDEKRDNRYLDSSSQETQHALKELKVAQLFGMAHSSVWHKHSDQ